MGVRHPVKCLDCLILAHVLAFLTGSTGVGRLAGRLLDQPQQAFLSVRKECLKVVGTKQARVDEVGPEIGIEAAPFYSRRGSVTSFQLGEIVGGRYPTDNPVRTEG